jgi:antitoxin component YwqK of YwqJK toxin-antitoxin module
MYKIVSDITEFKKGMAMKQYSMKLDGDRVRFTPDGKIAVVDAIRALSARKNANRIWESLKTERPEFKDLCQNHKFKEDKTDSVVDGEGWKKIEDALLDYILHHNASVIESSV